MRIKRVTEVSIWVMFISKDSDMRTLDNCLKLLLTLLTMDFISGQLISLTNPIHGIPVQYVNKLGK